mmetsp:Transcript_23326/g.28658  ORF Transcript_23326/g.28658 Transcript_23326/m.28658 type:complete len:125 (+) Transcript_23326:227-601(+)
MPSKNCPPSRRNMPSTKNMMYVTDLLNKSKPIIMGRWKAVVKVFVIGSNGEPVNNVKVEGSFTDAKGKSKTKTKTTNALGRCTLTLTNLKSEWSYGTDGISNSLFQLTNLTSNNADYDPSQNVM